MTSCSQMHKPPCHRSVLAENPAPASRARVGLSDARVNEQTVKLHRFFLNIHHEIFLCVSVLVRLSPFSPLHRQSFLLLLPWPTSFPLCGFHSNGSPCPWRLSIPNWSRSCERRLQSFSTSLFTTSSFLFFSPSSLAVSFTFFILSAPFFPFPHPFAQFLFLSVSVALFSLSCALSVFQFLSHADARSQCL